MKSSEGTYVYQSNSLEISYWLNSGEVKETHNVKTHTETKLVLVDDQSKNTLEFEAVEFLLDISLDPTIKVSGESYVYIISQITSGSPDYSYIYGGTKLINGKAQMRLESLPDEALNVYESNGETQKLGVAVIVVISGKKITDGVLEESDDLNNRVVGAVSNVELIYKAGDSSIVDWTTSFESGFSLGKGADNPDPEKSHDIFVPIENKALIIIKNFIFPNWT